MGVRRAGFSPQVNRGAESSAGLRFGEFRAENPLQPRAQHGGDPDRLVLWGHSAGADLIAGYVGHSKFHEPKGHSVKAAIMLSGYYERGVPAYFGTDPAEREKRLSTEGLKNATIPLFVARTEFDTPTAVEQGDALKNGLCDVGRCPTYVVFKDHSHLSQAFSVGTTDTSVSGPILEFLRKSAFMLMRTVEVRCGSIASV
jgi:triacylglycerol lipase